MDTHFLESNFSKPGVQARAHTWLRNYFSTTFNAHLVYMQSQYTVPDYYQNKYYMRDGTRNITSAIHASYQVLQSSL